MRSTLGSYRLVKELAPIYKDPYKDPLMTCPVQAGEERFCLALLRPASISHSLRNRTRGQSWGTQRRVPVQQGSGSLATRSTGEEIRLCRWQIENNCRAIGELGRRFQVGRKSWPSVPAVQDIVCSSQIVRWDWRLGAVVPGPGLHQFGRANHVHFFLVLCSVISHRQLQISHSGCIYTKGIGKAAIRASSSDI